MIFSSRRKIFAFLKISKCDPTVLRKSNPILFAASASEPGKVALNHALPKFLINNQAIEVSIFLVRSFSKAMISDLLLGWFGLRST